MDLCETEKLLENPQTVQTDLKLEMYFQGRTEFVGRTHPLFIHESWPNFDVKQENLLPPNALIYYSIKKKNKQKHLSLPAFRFSKPGYFFTSKEHH